MRPGCVLLDWGDTLMVDFPQYAGPMMQWPQVEAVPHAREVLERLRVNGWLSALATNAADSDEADIRFALARVDLDRLLDRVYCSRGVGHAKPSHEFFAFIAKDLGLSAAELVMVGDSYEKDVLGANAAGIRGVWLSADGQLTADSEIQRVIGDLNDLPGLLDSWT